MQHECQREQSRPRVHRRSLVHRRSRDCEAGRVNHQLSWQWSCVLNVTQWFVSRSLVFLLSSSDNLNISVKKHYYVIKPQTYFWLLIVS